MIRRSERNKRKRDVYRPNKDEQVKQKQSNTNNSKTPIDPSVSSDSDSDSELKPYEICIGCGKGKIAKPTDWIECDNCRNWWHCSCANISKKDAQKLNKYNIKFCCAFCIVRKSEILDRAQRIVNYEDTCNTCNTKRAPKDIKEIESSSNTINCQKANTPEH